MMIMYMPSMLGDGKRPNKAQVALLPSDDCLMMQHNAAGTTCQKVGLCVDNL